MTIEAAIDNDVVIKCSCYNLLEDLGNGLGGPGSVGILAVAKYVVNYQLARLPGIVDKSKAINRFSSFLATVDLLEPEVSEIELAAAIEEAAIGSDQTLHSGESQLCAMVLSRSIPMLITGDKRAIQSLEAIQSSLGGQLTTLRGRVASFEQAILGLVRTIGASKIRECICGEPEVDKTMSICFECTDARERSGFKPVGLNSYIQALRLAAPAMLWPGDALFEV